MESFQRKCCDLLTELCCQVDSGCCKSCFFHMYMCYIGVYALHSCVFVFRCNSFNKLTDRFFKSSPWPEAETVAKVVHGGNFDSASLSVMIQMINNNDVSYLICLFRNNRLRK